MRRRSQGARRALELRALGVDRPDGTHRRCGDAAVATLSRRNRLSASRVAHLRQRRLPRRPSRLPRTRAAPERARPDRERNDERGRHDRAESLPLARRARNRRASVAGRESPSAWRPRRNEARRDRAARQPHAAARAGRRTRVSAPPPATPLCLVRRICDQRKVVVTQRQGPPHPAAIRVRHSLRAIVASHAPSSRTRAPPTRARCAERNACCVASSASCVSRSIVRQTP